MDRKNYSRRDFLKTFAALSAAPLLANMIGGCGSTSSEPLNQVAYGPNPSSPVYVNGMFFLDAQSNQMTLSGNQNVPVHTSFVIQFNDPMNVTSATAAITFIDANSNPVSYGTSWDYYGMIATISPSADLAHAACYTLSVKDTATNLSGTRLTVNANASAAFKTAS